VIRRAENSHPALFAHRRELVHQPRCHFRPRLSYILSLRAFHEALHKELDENEAISPTYGSVSKRLWEVTAQFLPMHPFTNATIISASFLNVAGPVGTLWQW
jgi:hypothetical protein